jgi:hypothetical protein
MICSIKFSHPLKLEKRSSLRKFYNLTLFFTLLNYTENFTRLAEKTMFTLKILKKSLLSGVNLQNKTLVASSRSLQLFRRPNDVKKDNEEVEDEEEPVQISLDDELIEDPEEKQRRIFKIRNKSRLLTQHLNILHDRVPYNQSESWIHETLKYKRMMYGKYGKASGVDPSKLVN